MPFTRGTRSSLSLPRRFVCDLLHQAKKVPSVPMQRRMQLVDLVAARSAWTQRVSWCAIFMKAYAIVAINRPELRRAYLPFPWPSIYQHGANIASVGIERNYEGEQGVFFARIVQPELLSLSNLDSLLRHHKIAPIEEIAQFRFGLWLSRLPLPLRRLTWWMGLNVSGLRRAQFFGTFGISVVASLGAAGLHLLSPLTTTLNYGTFEPDGALDVRIVYDHRVMDGGTVARAMGELEEVLCGTILEELRTGAMTSQPNPIESNVLVG
jgi:hypothetical protein